MISSLWIASSEGRLEEVQELLRTASADVNVRDHNSGTTPLIEAVKNGHIEVVHALLAHGADPMSASAEGPPQAYTQDPSILEILSSAQAKIVSLPPSHENGFYPQANGDVYPPAIPYSYYPPYNTSLPEGAIYYPPPPQPQVDSQSMAAPGLGNLPPPDIARQIPCRYFPACRYGSACLFAHPQGPFISGPLPPPAQYPTPYDPMNTNYPPNDYYPMSAPSFPQHPLPNGMNPLMSSPNGAPAVHPPEMLPPPQAFSPNGAPPAPFTIVSPVGEPAPYLPQPYHQPPLPSQPQQQPMPPNMYNNTSAPAPSFVVSNGIHPYPPIPVSPSVGYPDGVINSPPLNSQSDTFAPVPTGPPVSHREPAGHPRRSSIRRGSFTSRKPPCLFFPAGKCKNGDECRFPHIQTTDYPAPHHSYVNGRGGAFKASRGHHNYNNNVNGVFTQTRPQNGHSETPVKTETKDGNRSRPGQGYKNASNRRPPPIKQQRVPDADEFPTLGNLASPPPKSSSVYFPTGNAHSGPTAAQVLQAPPPQRDSFPLVNGTHTSSESGSVKDSELSGTPKSASASVAPKLPISFATIAATGAPEVAAEVSVSA
ncbi:hypothetical protein J3R30DRAFT_3282740 [Lentinula aciculospora]|uniref:C3H1-type domain-containing protein n=1 Tax=Lentinula aciculospora TaxID=153920 RepID=A0A9W9DUN9_9AGAR|nr:hypothetical protein J3R30DRAFT_3282740 [Lentinula aciculospora]